MDVIFDIDGTLADCSHRLHFINDSAFFVRKGIGPLRPDWDSFLSDEQVAKDTPIKQTWEVLVSLLLEHHNVLFVTGRNESTREMTYSWLRTLNCPTRCLAAYYWDRAPSSRQPVLYMRSNGDRRPSHEVKRDLLKKIRADNFKPTLAFDDRSQDAEMYRSKGVMCCQVAEGNY